MAIYCLLSNKARVYYRKYKKPDPTTDVCWGFSGKGLCNDSYYLFLGCGKEGYIGAVVESGACPKNGQIAKPYIDGKDITSSRETGLKSGTEIIFTITSQEQIDQFVADGYNLRGDCNSCEFISCVKQDEEYIDIEKDRILQYISINTGSWIDNDLNTIIVPPECIDIVINNVQIPIDVNAPESAPDEDLINTALSGSFLIKRVCSDEGCPPPEYEVECKPCCPEGTCRVECGSITCCYNEKGELVKRCK